MDKQVQIIDIHAIFQKGGKPLLDFLDYCVRSIQMDAVFVFLVGEYRVGATTSKAFALYDMFCAPQAPGRLSASYALPPYDARLAEYIKTLAKASASDGAQPQNPSPPFLPPRYLFDALVSELEKKLPSAPGLLRYDASRTPLENLPGGKMNVVQSHFVQNVWEPIMRPRLVSAGFWRVGTIA